MKLHPYWITGFVDGEGTFYVGITRHPEMSVGYQILPEFRIVQHEKDIQLLYALKSFFQCGVVRVNHGDRYELRVRKLESLTTVIIPFFEKYPLNSKKKFDFLKFRKVIHLMNQKKHMNKDGLLEIIHLSKQMNRGYKPVAESFEKEIRNG